MELNKTVTKKSIKFILAAKEEICRLCFSSTLKKRISLLDEVHLTRTYCEETVTFYDMFVAIGVKIELSLPETICLDCGANVINSYLFKKLCQFSDERWSNLIDSLDRGIEQAETINKSHRSIFIIANEDRSVAITGRNKAKEKNKKYELKRLRRIQRHNRTYVRKRHDYICQVCGETYAVKEYFLRHLKLNHNLREGNYSCKDCGDRKFMNHIALEQHIDRFHKEKNIPCPKCTKMFSTDKAVIQHDYMHHVSVPCKVCGELIQSRSILNHHKYKHRQLVCPTCGKSYQNRTNYKNHIKTCGKIKKEIKNEFCCDICNASFLIKPRLKQHLFSAHGFGKFVSCQWCDKKFTSDSYLKSHIVKHTKERKFHCEICGGLFVTNTALKYHMRLHTGERPYPCDECDESFINASRRTAHKKKKHYVPMEECPVCFKKFVLGNAMKKHFRLHTNPNSKMYVSGLNSHV